MTKKCHKIENKLDGVASASPLMKCVKTVKNGAFFCFLFHVEHDGLKNNG